MSEHPAIRVLFGIFIVALAIAGITLAAAWLAGAAFFLVSGTNPIGLVHVGTWWGYWQDYNTDTAVRSRLVMAALYGTLIALLPVIGITAVYSKIRKRRSLHGDARFETKPQMRRAGLLGSSSEPGIIIGKLGPAYLMLRGMLSAMLTATTGSGKGVGMAVPNALCYPDSMVALDVKGELCELTSAYRASRGQKVYRFAPFDPSARTHRWNPLEGLSMDERVRVSEVVSLAFTLYPDSARDSGDIWQPMARSLFTGLALYVLETPSLPSTIGEILRQGSGNGQSLRDHVEGLLRERNFRPHVVSTNSDGEPVVEYRRLLEWDGNGEPLLSERCVIALETFTMAKGNTSPSIAVTFAAPLTIWQSPIVDAATSASDFNVGELRARLMSLYVVVTPDKLPEARVLLSLLFSRIVSTNTQVQLRSRRTGPLRFFQPVQRPVDEQNVQPTHSCLLLLDEFAALGYMPIIDKAAAYLRGYGLRLLTICQSEGQIRVDPPRGYGRESARALVTNHGARILYTPALQEDAEEYSAALGFETVKARTTQLGRRRQHSESDHRRALMLAQELREMPKDEQIIIGVEGLRPIRCERIRYYLDETFIGLLREMSPGLRSLGKRLPTKDEIDAVVEMGDLEVHVSALDLDHHQAVTERRTREAKPGDVVNGVDLSRVAVSFAGVPMLEDDAPDSAVEAMVSAFWQGLEDAGQVDDLAEDSTNVDTETGEWLGEAGPSIDLGAIETAYLATERA